MNLALEEIAVNQFLQSFATPMLTEAFKAITDLGNPAFWFIIAAWLFWLGYERRSFIVMSLILFVGVIAGGLKIAIMRPRPFETGQITALVAETGYSFPSGHATIAGAFAAYGWFTKWVRKSWKYLLILMAIGVAISRIYLGVHYLSDVIAGLILGGAIGWAVFRLEARIHKMHFHISKIEEELAVVLFFIAMVALYFFMPEAYAAAWAVLGYFAGYAVFRHTKIDLSLEKSKSKKLTFFFILIGTAILGGAGYIANKNPNIFGDALFFISGVFMTVIWPLVMMKTVQKMEIRPKNRT